MKGGGKRGRDGGTKGQKGTGREGWAISSLQPLAWHQPPLPGYSSPNAPAHPQAWAIHKGKHLEGIDKEDPSTWKTRLRCALNKSADFCEVRERSQLDISNPYKVYRLVSDGAHGPGTIIPLEVAAEDGSLGKKDLTLPICKTGNDGFKLMGW